MTVPTSNAALPVPGATDGHWVHDLDPVALHLGFLDIRWYSLGYLAGIVLGYFYLLRLIKQPGAPMARRHADDFVFYVTLGIILGGRLGYVLFYNVGEYLQHPLEILKLWDGGMSFHGGLIGSTLAVAYLCWRNKLNFLRVADYATICGPFGLFLVRLANFVNGELWGSPSDAPWAVRFCEMRDATGACQLIGPPRHPSQLYEAALEGVVLFLILWALFWFTRSRYRPGFIAGAFLFFYGVFRMLIELFRLPDSQLVWLKEQTGLSMGQWLCVPMILLGLYLMLTARRREAALTASPDAAPAEPQGAAGAA